MLFIRQNNELFSFRGEDIYIDVRNAAIVFYDLSYLQKSPFSSQELFFIFVYLASDIAGANVYTDIC